MAEASVVLITTNAPNPEFSYFEHAVRSVERSLSDFVEERILSVDLLPLPDGIAPPEYFKAYEEQGWRVIFGAGGTETGIADNHRRGVKAASHPWVLTCEDDSFVTKIPTREEMQQIVDEGIYFLLYNANFPTSQHERVREHMKHNGNYIMLNDDMVLRKGTLGGNYQIAFPALLAPRKHLLRMHETARNVNRRRCFEFGMTAAWRKLYRDKGIGIYLKKTMCPDIPIEPEDLPYYANLLYHNNSPELRHESLMGRACNRI